MLARWTPEHLIIVIVKTGAIWFQGALRRGRQTRQDTCLWRYALYHIGAMDDKRGWDTYQPV